MKKHGRKMIAPIVVSILVIAYYIVYFVFLIALLDGAWKYLLGIVPVALAFLMLRVCLERIQEIQEGEEDDIGKY